MQLLAWRQSLRWLGPAVFIVAMGVGCRTSTSDVHRWGNTKQGPRKLVAVLTHDKYLIDLRVEAAKTLIEMKPRNGKRVGIVGEEGEPDNRGVINAIASLPADERNEIVGRLVPMLVAEMGKPIPSPQAGQPAPVDTSFPFKDAAFALLTYERERLVQNPADRSLLEQALAAWCVVDFARRVDDPSQLFGVEQVLKYLKADGVRAMPMLLAPEGKKTELIASLIADLGDAKTKLAASQRLVKIAADIASPQWKERKKPAVTAANEASKLKPTPEQFEAQLDQYQEEELLRIFSSMKRVAGVPIVEYLLSFAKDSSRPEKRRAAALAALEGNIVKSTTSDGDAKTLEQIGTVMEIARSDDTPDQVREQALRRVGEMPRKLVVERLFELFRHEKWKIRWMAADLVLSMSDSEQLAEVLTKLSEATKKLAIAEPLQYGFRIGELKGKTKPAALAAQFAAANQPIAARFSGLGYYFHYGTKAELPLVTTFENDTTKVPEAPDCEGNDQGCVWECEVVEGESRSVKEIATLGQFVKFCIEPAMESRKDPPKKNADPRE
ncbi:MAG: HEAT repeat domain-containing protein [Polyangiaceae bacterium]|nr:HEAT repeat domain-containing protein [Polyangiaceae bacterium]